MEINNLERFLEKARTAGPALGACITFSDPAVTEVACALILGIITNLMLSGKKHEDSDEPQQVIK